MIRFILNEKTIATDLPAGMVLLDFIRYHQHMMGTKIGCREGDCGACTVLVGGLVETQDFASPQNVVKAQNVLETQNVASLRYASMTSCLMPLGNVQGKHIVTIEGINLEKGLNPIQQAMADEGATQCGFCTPGFVVSLAGFCLQTGKEDVITAMDGNICRCTGYKSIERAASKVAALMKKRNGEEPTSFVVRKKILPAYFDEIKNKLQLLQKELLTTPDSRLLTPDSMLPTPDSRLLTPDSRLPTQLAAGGTDLYVQKHEEMINSTLRFVFDDPGLKGISKEGNKCIIGASVTMSDLKASPVINEAFHNFPRYAKLVSSTPIRNMATIAGNFINASPIGDLTIFFLALDAKIELISNSASGEESVRTIALRELYKGYKELNKTPREYIRKITFELPRKNALFHFEKVSKRTHLDIASVNSAISITMNGDSMERVGISAGGVGPIPMYLQKTSAYLKGKKVSDVVVQEAIEVMKTEISPISDARGTKEYKTLMLGQLIKAHFMELFAEMATEKLFK